jgi:carbon monoxide dehydrogenase subunit G
MELTHEFGVPVPPAQAWSVLTDVERIAPCLPGAQLQEIEGEEYRGIVKVKVGPITAQYKGKATFLEKDPDAGKLVLRCEGRDTRGQGNANATITATLHPDDEGTTVTVVTDLTVTGKVAQFGRGVMADVSSKLLEQFVNCLESKVLGGEAGEAQPEPAPAASPAPAPSSSAAGGTQEAAETAAVATEVASSAAEASNGSAATSSVRKVDAPEVAPVDLLDAAGGSVAKRALPLVGALVAVLLVILWRSRRKP